MLVLRSELNSTEATRHMHSSLDFHTLSTVHLPLVGCFAMGDGPRTKGVQGWDVREEQIATEALDCAQELADLLDTGLSRDAVAAIAKLCEQGVNAEALAAVVKEIQRESSRIKAWSSSFSQLPLMKLFGLEERARLCTL